MSAGLAGTFWFLPVLSLTDLESFSSLLPWPERELSCVAGHVMQDVAPGCLSAGAETLPPRPNRLSSRGGGTAGVFHNPKLPLNP